MPYRWEPREGAAGRYRDTTTGRYVSGATVRRELDRYLDNTDTAARQLAEALRGRQISLADWELGMRRLVKSTHINAVALDRGGYANLRPADFGRVGQIVREQYGYLRNFAKQIENGDRVARGLPLTEAQKAIGVQRLDGTLGTRASLYVDAGRNSMYRSHQANLKPTITHQRSIRTKRDSCRDCLDLDRKVFAIGDPSFPLPGRRACNHRCGCHLEYLSLGDNGEYEAVETL